MDDGGSYSAAPLLSRPPNPPILGGKTILLPPELGGWGGNHRTPPRVGGLGGQSATETIFAARLSSRSTRGFAHA